MDFDGTAPISSPAKNLEFAKLLLVFIVHGVERSILLLLSQLEPNSTFGPMRGIVVMVLAKLPALVTVVVNVLVGRLSGLTRMFRFNEGWRCSKVLIFRFFFRTIFS